MAAYIIHGGNPLHGTVRAAANKNGVLPIMAATLLTDEPCILRNVPVISAVRVMAEILCELGADVQGIGTQELRICCSGVNRNEVRSELAIRERGSILVMSPLVARLGGAKVARPGGCVIGRRDVGTHLDAIEALGAVVEQEHDYYAIRAPKLCGTTIFLDEASVTATENTMMAACAADGTTIIKHAACEPHVVDFGNFLIAMGAQIEGLGSNVVTIHGGRSLHGASYAIGPDHIDVGTFAAAAAMTGGDLTIEGIDATSLDMIVLVLRRMGVDVSFTGDCMTVSSGRLQAVRKIGTDVWPGFPTDMASVFVALATQADGTTLIHDWMYEGRMFFVDRLVSMGAGIILCDPHRCAVSGPTQLHGKRVHCPDLRAGMALVLAGLAADGTTEITGAELVERGYENIVARLASIGACLEKVDR
jgi:UDP-N-acetylglucosamine 1-carboxyvinyltransferase